ncbi:hypothetical protein DMN91_002392 [Ooceraea biroi]|uniref:Uncharacterized protein n=1 Tax=Ooceraea biroi TaxID=2015173 RepID=A0A026WP91_OOCBI|nr:uncharacterized protein LOC105277032 [Ooceraea biroi]XP_011333456.1 uncharacterized protein LOC105277032 [Ooceraea biroi]EZA57835.1 hypothetical protein X777_00937 [Ooceraea biroi]RLU24304.1 hypothetical protein DMN91_002392 [Ooceraea biroi]
MKILCSLMMVLILRPAIAGIVRKPPAFSTPIYSNSYLPAAMQVIFHAVEQLKLLQAEEILQEHLASKTTTTTTTSRTTRPMKHQLQSTTPAGISTAIVSSATAKVQEETSETLELSLTSIPASEAYSEGSPDNLMEAAQLVETSDASVSDRDHEEVPEANAETTEINYATPETNYESPESVQETQEQNQELPEKSEEEMSSTNGGSATEVSVVDATSQYDGASFITDPPSGQKKEQSSVDRVVDEIYEIVKTTTPSFNEEPENSESKNATKTSSEKENEEADEEEETRFTLLGEKVVQVPRPSLSSYLRRTKVPSRPALQQLANLYDVLSKDARKQGYARFAGYSDEVLKDLQSSAEGGVGPQLKKLLEKVIERNELTRDDAKMRTSQALRDLDDPASALSKDLRRLLPLRYTA